ncbi:MAG: sulfur carrier protein ThiS [Eubacteriales bacterium]|nr:sulfur carrier protein ThiS [Eubacteriales bacterium]
MTVNGAFIPASEGLTVSQLLEQRGYQESRIAVEVNRAIVPKGQYQSHLLHDDDIVEIVCFMGGD